VSIRHRLDIEMGPTGYPLLKYHLFYNAIQDNVSSVFTRTVQCLDIYVRHEINKASTTHTTMLSSHINRTRFLKFIMLMS